MADTTDKTPLCVGIIMDGNRRWAKERGLLSFEGHKAGVATLKNCIRWAKDTGVSTLIFYVFSTENWGRSKEEVGYMMELLSVSLESELEEIKKENVRVKFLGQKTRLPENIQHFMEKWETETGTATQGTVAFALSYGGRAEIVDTVNRLFSEKKHPITEEDFSSSLWTAGIPDPDLIIRTGGEQRLSNFLPWQSIYSELFFTKTYWPAFSKGEFISILDAYNSREQRRGT